jgi:hypothetical protein
MMMSWKKASFSDLGGMVIDFVQVDESHERVEFWCQDRVFKLEHEQDCCESVTLEELHGDWADLVGHPILAASEVTGGDEPPKEGSYVPESYTWTFYRLSTIRGTVTMRWYGESNGYYSEDVHVSCVPRRKIPLPDGFPCTGNDMDAWIEASDYLRERQEPWLDDLADAIVGSASAEEVECEVRVAEISRGCAEQRASQGARQEKLSMRAQGSRWESRQEVTTMRGLAEASLPALRAMFPGSDDDSLVFFASSVALRVDCQPGGDGFPKAVDDAVREATLAVQSMAGAAIGDDRVRDGLMEQVVKLLGECDELRPVSGTF